LAGYMPAPAHCVMKMCHILKPQRS
jgi:hypothetical protein